MPKRAEIEITLLTSEEGEIPQAMFSYKGASVILPLNEANEDSDPMEVAQFYAKCGWGIALTETMTNLRRAYDPDLRAPTYKTKGLRGMEMGEAIIAMNDITKNRICVGFIPKMRIYGDGFLADLKAYMPSKRSYINSDIRKSVYEKCDGHCAYCGKKILYGEMQVDHVESHYRHLGTDTLDNYLPSCRDCNGLKSDYYLEEFREKLIPDCGRKARAGGMMALRGNARYVRIAKAYDLLRHPNKKIEFYFERMNKDEI